MNEGVRYRLRDGRELWLPVYLGSWVCVPHGLLAHEPELVWCADCRLEDVLGPGTREWLGQVEIDGERLDPDAGVFLVARGEWERRFGARERDAGRTLASPTRGFAPGVTPAGALAHWAPAGALVGRRGSGASARALRLARAARELGRAADVHLAASWIAQSLLGGLNLVVLWATLSWARGAWERSGADVMGGLLLAVVALLIGAGAQRLRHGERGPLAPATFANACGVLAMGVVAVVLVLGFLGLP